MATSVIATRGLKPAEFTVGEHVLCFEPDPTKARVLYDSKILELEWTKEENTNRRVPEYLVHFSGWNSSWDRWAPANFILRYTDENLELKGKLHRQALAKMGKKKKKKTIAELVELAKRRQAGKGSDSDMSSVAADSDDSDGNSSGEELEALEIPIPLPDALKIKLEDDCYFITRKQQLVRIPCKHTILEIMEGYVRHFAINVHTHDKKSQAVNVISTVAKEGMVLPPLPKYNVDLCKEVMDGLRTLFDFLLPTNLLYGPEKEQYKKLVITSYVQDHVKVPSKSPAKRGRPRKHSISPIKEPIKSEPIKSEPIKAVPSPESDKDKSQESPSRRVTRRLSTSEHVTLVAPLPPTKKRRCSEQDHQHRSRRHSADTTTTQNKDTASGHGVLPKPGVRHSTRLASVSSIASSPSADIVYEEPPQETPQTQSETPQPQTNQSTSTNGKTPHQNGKNSKGIISGDNVCDIKLPSCKLLADNAHYDGRMPPCKIYGAQHLIRLFVKLPELLGKMELPPKKLRPLLKHIELFLKYLAHPERLDEFFPESSYVSAHAALQKPNGT
ncbi:MSL complex subunit 3-like [Asterias amurensis]|uniref:MSL complex subunit 3-like n=1 Tax=Asterias amurensis TaxID=7602 RepID=UPI003AB885C9